MGPRVRYSIISRKTKNQEVFLYSNLLTTPLRSGFAPFTLPTKYDMKKVDDFAVFGIKYDGIHWDAKHRSMEIKLFMIFCDTGNLI